MLRDHEQSPQCHHTQSCQQEEGSLSPLSILWDSRCSPVLADPSCREQTPGAGGGICVMRGFNGSHGHSHGRSHGHSHPGLF